MSKWQEKLIKEIGTVITGITPPTKQLKYYGDIYPFATPSDLSYDTYKFNKPEKKLSVIAFNEFKNNFIPKNSVMFTSIASIGKIGITTEITLTNQQINSIIVNKNNNAYFLYYNLKLNTSYFKAISSGVATPIVNKSTFEKIKLLIPDLATQEKIADILSTYDDLIENNNRRIEILEQMAQEIYKEWFVRFRFPGHEKVKFINGLPEGWEVKKIKDFGNIITGKTPSTDVYENYGKDIMFIKTPDMHDAVFTTYSSEYLSEKGHLTQVNKLIPANSILVSCIGTAGIVSINAEAAHTNQQINSIVLNDKNLLYWLFFSCRFLKNTIELYGATGATMANLSKGKFENLKILMPKQELVYLYNNKVNNIFSHIKKLLYLNQNLIKQRDLLLPRLMSGKLEV